ncbi:MAG: hypothetical protein CME06_05690 [Gemmatimonadetes bacterium]|nr:hypothetical protein [Gemmatimonadota bacterium]
MKTISRRLVLLRHAKSSWKRPDHHDRDRPLSARGRRDAPRVAERLVALGWEPEQIVSSDARRARETAKLLLGAFGDGVEITLDPALYSDGASAILDSLSGLEPSVGAAMVVGHNPDMEWAVRILSRSSIGFGTATAVLLSIDNTADWAEASGLAGEWTVEGVIRPDQI